MRNKRPQNSHSDKKVENNAPPETSSSSKLKADVPKDRINKASHSRSIVAPPSWTGKLPASLLHEHCQKEGWKKVEYSMKHDRNGYLATAILSRQHPKSNDTETVRLTPIPADEGYKPTPVEARHFTAVYALHRVSSNKNHHLVLPPEHKAYWHNLQNRKQEAIKSNSQWMYATDPFGAKRERENRQKFLETRRAEEATARGLAQEAGLMVDDVKYDKSWDKYPSVDMVSSMRRMVEGVVRKHYPWHEDEAIPENLRGQIVDEYTNFGFRKSHVEEACEYTKDAEEALEWLLIHVPEDDLPPRFLPRDYSTGVSITPMSTGGLAIDYAVKRLCHAGYTADIAREVFLENGHDEMKANAELLRNLLGLSDGDVDYKDSGIDDEIWSKELSTLEAIFSTRQTIHSPTRFSVLLNLSASQRGQTVPKQISVEFTRPPYYPHCLPPPFVITCQPSLPAYIRLSLLRHASLFAWENLRGEGMVFGIVGWLEDNFFEIVDRPGPLRVLSSVVSGEALVSLPKKVRRDVKVKSIMWSPDKRKWGQEFVKEGRRSLPAWKSKDEIDAAVSKNQIVIVTGDTGSGKSTQVPQFILSSMRQSGYDAIANIVVTQPRRLSALSLAERVTEEMGEVSVGETVGYIIRGVNKTSAKTKIRFVTIGVVLRMFTHGQHGLEGVTHVIVDEIHERSVDSDFLLLLLKNLLKSRNDLTVVLMSATLDARILEEYFKGSGKVGRVHIEGKMFPVSEIYLDEIVAKSGFVSRIASRYGDDDGGSKGAMLHRLAEGINYELIAKIVEMIVDKSSERGGILIFLPGLMEISFCIKILNSSKVAKTMHILPLHASLPPEKQRLVFGPPPTGKQKIIVSTNVAETSITIEDITIVIDSGKVKQLEFDARTNIVRLVETWTSVASTKQRQGRAGRVRPGECFKLFTRAHASTEMPATTEPEIARLPLEQLCLQAKSMGVKNVISFLGMLLTPPKVPALERSLKTLSDMGALESDGLSALGKHMATIPADLRCSKLMVLGGIFGCLSTTITIAGIIAVKSPFISSTEKGDAVRDARQRFSNGTGDLMTDVKAYDQWKNLQHDKSQWEVRRWCDENFLSHTTLTDIDSMKSSFVSSLYEAGLLHSTSSAEILKLSIYSTNESLIRSLIASALYPNIARVDMPGTKYHRIGAGALALETDAKRIKFFTPPTDPMATSGKDDRCFIHPGSTLFTANSFVDNAPYISFFAKVQTSKVFLRHVTPASVFAVLLLCGDKVIIEKQGKGIIVGEGDNGEGGLKLKGWARIGTLVGILRRLVDDRLQTWFENPSEAHSGKNTDEVIDCVRKLVEVQGIT